MEICQLNCSIVFPVSTSSVRAQKSHRISIISRLFAGLLSFPSLRLPWSDSHENIFDFFIIFVVINRSTGAPLASRLIRRTILRSKRFTALIFLLKIIKQLKRRLHVPLLHCALCLGCNFIVSCDRTQKFTAWEPRREEEKSERPATLRFNGTRWSYEFVMSLGGIEDEARACPFFWRCEEETIALYVNFLVTFDKLSIYDSRLTLSLLVLWARAATSGEKNK